MNALFKPPRILLLLAILFVACLPVVMPACKAVQAEGKGNFLLDIAKAVTKANLEKLFPDASFEKDNIQVSKEVTQDFLRQVFHEKVRHFLTPKGHLEAITQDFEAKVSWERIGEKVKISLVYVKMQDTSRADTINKARDKLRRDLGNEQKK
jgi:predicted polyphosphate/ATP-dependent NAD kinase